MGMGVLGWTCGQEASAGSGAEAPGTQLVSFERAAGVSHCGSISPAAHSTLCHIFLRKTTSIDSRGGIYSKDVGSGVVWGTGELTANLSVQYGKSLSQPGRQPCSWSGVQHGSGWLVPSGPLMAYSRARHCPNPRARHCPPQDSLTWSAQIVPAIGPLSASAVSSCVPLTLTLGQVPAYVN